MPIFELTGMPRSGKTTATDATEKRFPTIVRYKEFFDKVPSHIPRDDPKYNHYCDRPDYNDWYGAECMKRIDAANRDPDKTRIHYFERSALDRVAVMGAFVEWGALKQEDLDRHMKIVGPYLHAHDRAVVILDSPENSISRITKPKKHFMQNPEFLEVMLKHYKALGNKFDNVTSVPEGSTVNEVIDILDAELKTLAVKTVGVKHANRTRL